MAPTSRKCTKCGVEKPLTEFHKQARGLYGVRSQCKACVAAAQRTCRCGAPAKNHGKCSDCNQAYMTQYRSTERGRERLNEGSRKSYRRKQEREPGAAARATAAWRAKNPEAQKLVSRAYVARRRARKMGAQAEAFTTQELYDHWAAHELWACTYCGAPWEHMDHFVPLTRGGAHSLDNLVPACAACNLAKSDKCPAAFLAEITAG